MRPAPQGAARVFDLCSCAAGSAVPRGGSCSRCGAWCIASRYLADGYDDQPIARSELETLLNDAARRAGEADAWHLLRSWAASPGWSDTAREFACGAGPKPFHDRLVERDPVRRPRGPIPLLSETDERGWGSSGPGIRQRGQRRGVARPGARGSSTSQESFRPQRGGRSADTLAEALGINRPVGLRAMKLLAAAGHHGLTVVDDLGPVLTLKP